MTPGFRYANDEASGAVRVNAPSQVRIAARSHEDLEVKRLLKRLKLDQPIVEVFSNDKRLADLASWDPRSDSAAG